MPAEHDGSGVPVLLSVKTSDGWPLCGGVAAVSMMDRLLVSAVKLSKVQPGAALEPLSTPTRTTSVVLASKFTRLLLPWPNTLNSASCHLVPRSEK